MGQGPRDAEHPRLRNATRPRFVAVGRVGRAHGVSGEVRIDPMGGLPRGLAGYTRFYLGRSNGGSEPSPRPVVVEHHRVHGRFVLVKFEGLDSPEAAGALRHALLFVERGEMPALEEGEYYHADLPGCRVVSSGGEELGSVADVFSTGAHDVLVVRSGGREWMLPVVGEYVLAVDVEAGEIRVAMPEGLRD